MSDRRIVENSVIVGGSGRSGTSYVCDVIRWFPTFLAFHEWEAKFLVEVDGLLDMYNALTKDYDASRSLATLERFTYMMLNDNGRDQLFARPEVVAQIPNETYLKLTQDYIRQLSIGEIPLRLTEDEFFALTQDYLESIFRVMARDDVNRRFVLKMPHTVLHVAFMRRLFPNAPILNVIRDPRAIVVSLQRQEWGPNTIEGCAYWLREFYRAYDLQLETAPHLANYITVIRLEDFSRNLEAATNILRRSCDLQDFMVDPETVDINAIEGWKATTSADTIAQIERILKPYILKWGYELMVEMVE